MIRPRLTLVLVAGMLALLAIAGAIARGVPLGIAGNGNAAAAFFTESISVDELLRTYRGVFAVDPITLAPRTGTARKVRILIVPGHEPDWGGTAFGDYYERDLAADLADALAADLSANPRYAVKVARSKTAWDPVLAAYFSTHADAILAFRAAQAEAMARHLADGSIRLAADRVDHISTPTAGAIELYGINRWAAEQHYDIVLHIHLNDYGGRRQGAAGAYDGFAVYVPDPQYSNAAASRAVGEAIAARLAAYHPASSLPQERAGVVPDQQLIALGANNSAESAALLIEYGYIYEPQFANPAAREVALADYAYATYLGLQDFFRDPVASTGSVAVPYDWPRAGASGKDAYALQATLRYEGLYPPPGETLHDCPLSGHVGPCTKAAIRAYEAARGLVEAGTFDAALRAALTRDAQPLSLVVPGTTGNPQAGE
jgi:N-acetylmuramoyl-L-alanine amidase